MRLSDFDLGELLFKYDEYCNGKAIGIDLADSLVGTVPLLIEEIRSLREENN